MGGTRNERSPAWTRFVRPPMDGVLQRHSHRRARHFDGERALAGSRCEKKDSDEGAKTMMIVPFRDP